MHFLAFSRLFIQLNPHVFTFAAKSLFGTAASSSYNANNAKVGSFLLLALLL